MARYIDADKVMEEIEQIGGHNLCEWETIGVKALIDRQPTVTRAEISREIFEWIETEIECSLKLSYLSLSEVEESESMWGMVHGRIDALRIMKALIEELKEKHTEDET